MSIWTQKSALIQPRTSPPKFVFIFFISSLFGPDREREGREAEKGAADEAVGRIGAARGRRAALPWHADVREASGDE